jgi:hypothetical protein
MSGEASARTQCLTGRELEVLRQAPPGGAPEDLARHLAGCERCQDRVLLDGQPRRPVGRDRPALPTPTRALFLLALMAAVIAAFLYTLRMLAGGS